MLKALPTILIVTTVAIAIWVVAEAESVRTEQFTAVLAVDPAGYEGNMARPDPARLWPARVSITAEGSAGALESLRSMLDQGLYLAPGRGLRREPGVYSQSLREALGSLEEIQAAGVTIAEVEPPAVWVEVAEQDSIELPVELDRTGLSLDTDPVIRPARVTITGPKRFIDLLTPGDSHAVVRLRTEELRRLIPGQPETISGLRVELPAEIPAGEFWGGTPMAPGAVEVTMTLRAQVRSLTIPSVGVLLAVAPVDYNDWDVIVTEQSRFLRDVVLTGPSDIIGQYERGERRVDAFVRLTFQDLEAGVAAGSLAREAQIGPLPPGVSADCEDSRVELLIRAREPSAGAEGPAGQDAG